jgi:hypothetical protein
MPYDQVFLDMADAADGRVVHALELFRKGQEPVAVLAALVQHLGGCHGTRSSKERSPRQTGKRAKGGAEAPGCRT